MIMMIILSLLRLLLASSVIAHLIVVSVQVIVVGGEYRAGLLLAKPYREYCLLSMMKPVGDNHQFASK